MKLFDELFGIIFTLVLLLSPVIGCLIAKQQKESIDFNIKDEINCINFKNPRFYSTAKYIVIGKYGDYLEISYIGNMGIDVATYPKDFIIKSCSKID